MATTAEQISELEAELKTVSSHIREAAIRTELSALYDQLRKEQADGQKTTAG